MSIKNKVSDIEEKEDIKGWALALLGGGLFSIAVLFLSSKSHSSMDSSKDSSVKNSEDIINTDNNKLSSNKKIETPMARLISPKKSQHKPKTKLQNNVKGKNNKGSNETADDELLDYGNLTKADMKMAKIAWTYFENNYQKETGLFNSANQFPSTSMWDTGSALSATIAAENFGLITKKEFDDKITALIKTLVTIELFDGVAPNKVYNTKTMKMVDYNNKEIPKGIGVSILDLARLVSWLDILTHRHPRFSHQVKQALGRWQLDKLVKNGRMYGIKRHTDTGETEYLQEGRLGYEQYAAKILQKREYDLSIASDYNNEHRKDVDIYGLNIATDNRAPEFFHASNAVVSESYILDAIENGIDEENRPLIENIYEVQKRRWEDTGIVTAVSEDNINRKPHFIYNSIFSGGKTWVAETSKGEVLQQHRTISNKAAIALSILFPNDEYSKILLDKVDSAYNPKEGWYSGIYENGEGYNSITTANTNGVILSALLYKKHESSFNAISK